MSALETVRSAAGLSDYLDAVEARLAEVVEAHPGTVASVGADALAAGGKRLRPTLTFLSSSPDAAPPVVHVQFVASTASAKETRVMTES